MDPSTVFGANWLGGKHGKICSELMYGILADFEPL